MSRDYFLDCVDCDSSLYIGRNGVLFIGTGSNAEDLEKFMYAHLGHNLVFVDEEDRRVNR